MPITLIFGVVLVLYPEPEPEPEMRSQFWLRLASTLHTFGGLPRYEELKAANILLGLYYLDASGHVPVNSDEFLKLYKKAMTEYTQKSFKLDRDFPLTCSTFAGYFLSRKATPKSTPSGSVGRVQRDSRKERGKAPKELRKRKQAESQSSHGLDGSMASSASNESDSHIQALS
ncbi:hypothetical protein FSARC_7436 [Fusarium sarcochroum]|uniref:Uncharacterized protein n=1 Tax=Fusarium sarcochroum TaxID=1208366 RepID=A0A8H4TVD2_9HYPO|nr:hypothetical protein FSARC_7436 [Fusarium sarcochroum]